MYYTINDTDFSPFLRLALGRWPFVLSQETVNKWCSLTQWNHISLQLKFFIQQETAPPLSLTKILESRNNQTQYVVIRELSCKSLSERFKEVQKCIDNEINKRIGD